jgi:ABC-type branched-subunit amino acid transport system substrate-binding protein
MVQDFVKAFKAKYGANEVPTHINAHAYDTVMVVADAVKRGGKDAQSIRDQLAKIKGLEVTTGIIAIDAKGQTTDPSVIHYVETTPDLAWKTLNWQ